MDADKGGTTRKLAYKIANFEGQMSPKMIGPTMFEAYNYMDRL